MNKHDIDKLVRWSGEYLRDKFRQMQTNFIMWISGLDNKNRIRLARNISFNQKRGE